MKPTRNLPGIVAMVLAAALFSLMDASMKLLSPHYPALEVTSLRALASLPLVYVLVAWRGGFYAMRHVRWRLHALRGVLGIAMLALFVFGLRHLPLTEVYAISFVAPLLITALSGPFLAEHVGPARWAAIVVGLTGVLVILRPSGTGLLTWGGIAVVGAAICYAMSAIIIRIVSRTDSMESLMFWLITALAVGSTVLAVPNWVPVRAEDAWLIAAIGVTGFCGQYGVTYAFRHGEASAVAPFEYTALAWSIGLDRALWQTAPDRYTLLGAAIVVASGIYLVRREKVHAESEHP